jgi:hypothetical protein
LIQIILGRREFKFVQTKRIALLQGEIIVNKKRYTNFFLNLVLKKQQAKIN